MSDMYEGRTINEAVFLISCLPDQTTNISLQSFIGFLTKKTNMKFKTCPKFMKIGGHVFMELVGGFQCCAR